MRRALQFDSREVTSPGVRSVIKARRRTVEGISVRRLLPTRSIQTVGPFIFFDHMGPDVLLPGKGVDVEPHPHIHLATVTYLFAGELVHRDSLGSVRTISPGDVNWMHAGSGIVHSERTGEPMRSLETRIEGIQLWVALPAPLEESRPEFHHYPKADLPIWNEAGLAARILAGEAFGCRSPVKTSSPTVYVDASVEAGAQFAVPEAEERALYVVSGSVSFNGEAYAEAQMIVLEDHAITIVTANCPSRVLILGGAPLDGGRHIWWNFVSSSLERIEQAKRDWSEDRFPTIPSDALERARMPSR